MAATWNNYGSRHISDQECNYHSLGLYASKVQEDFLSFFNILSLEHLTLFQWLHFNWFLPPLPFGVSFSCVLRVLSSTSSRILNIFKSSVGNWSWFMQTSHCLFDQNTFLPSFSVIFAFWPRMLSFLISISFSISCREWYEMNGCTSDKTNPIYLPFLEKD